MNLSRITTSTYLQVLQVSVPYFTHGPDDTDDRSEWETDVDDTVPHIPGMRKFAPHLRGVDANSGAITTFTRSAGGDYAYIQVGEKFFITISTGLGGGAYLRTTCYWTENVAREYDAHQPHVDVSITYPLFESDEDDGIDPYTEESCSLYYRTDVPKSLSWRRDT